jgi:hypothetical protein
MENDELLVYGALLFLLLNHQRKEFFSPLNFSRKTQQKKNRELDRFTFKPERSSRGWAFDEILHAIIKIFLVLINVRLLIGSWRKSSSLRCLQITRLLTVRSTM